MENDSLIISQDCQQEDNLKIKNIKTCIANNDSWILKAGAGSGKTHTLIETLKELIKSDGDILKYNNQKIACITFTNVAANEIINRIGVNGLISVSTIHDFVWGIISKYQKLLLRLVLEDIKIKKKEVMEKLEEYEFEAKIESIVLSNVDEFWKSYNLKAKEFKNNYSNKYFPDINFSNVAKFKEILKLIIEKDKYTNFDIDKLQNKIVTYDTMRNNDNLVKLRISHDTVLRYFEQMVMSNDKFKNVICSCYPYILVDECQDTKKEIINALNILKEYARINKLKFSIGLYGDEMQSIYETFSTEQKYSEYKCIESKFNWRSADKIINLANKIRSDGLTQSTIYLNNNVGNIQVFLKSNSDDYLNDIIEPIKNDLGINQTNQLHVFLLKNDLVAKYNGFYSLYEYFKNGLNYNELNNYFFSTNINMLGKLTRLIYSIMMLISYFENNKTRISTLLSSKLRSNISFEDLKLIKLKISSLKLNRDNKFKETLESLWSYDNDPKGIWKQIISSFCDDCCNMDDFKIYIASSGLKFSEDYDIYSILNIPLKEFCLWYKYINKDFESIDVVYQTYHSTKGLEYDNVLIDLNGTFDKKEIFKNWFSNPDDENNNLARKILYVAVTRAKKNLIAIVNDDMSKLNLFEELFCEYMPK
ncbi:MAG TPA: hypothetical protein DHU33_02105 [Firmicutes bacterium]|nr:hypothetical protein [Bacillota bacterium]